MAAELHRLVDARADTGELHNFLINRLLALLRPIECDYGDLRRIALEPRLQLRIWRLWKQACDAVVMPEWESAEDLAETIEKLFSPPGSEPGNQRIELIPGGFAFLGRPYKLTGRQRDMLEALLNARYRRCFASELREALGVDDEKVLFPEQVIKDVAGNLRGALKTAIRDADLPDTDPLPSSGKGKDLSYRLDDIFFG
jgi:hypothetical protein